MRISIPEEHLPYVIEQFERQASGEFTLATDIPVRRKDSSIFYADINSFPITLAAKTYLMGIFRDVTQRKKAEEALEVERQRLYSLLEGLPAFVYLQAEDHSVRFANRYFRKHFGDPEGKRCYEVLLGAKEPCKPCPTFRVFETKKPQIWEWSQSPDGRIYEINDYPFSDVDGSPLVLELGINITERKRVERALAESEEKYRTVVESAGEAIATFDKKGVCSFMNTMAAKKLGGKPEDFVGKTMWDLFPKQTADRQTINVRRVMNTGEEMSMVELIELQGQPTWYNTTIEPLRDVSGKTTAAMVIARDIHELKQAQEQLDRYREEMARTEQLASLGTLSATLAHELSQPLTVIRLSIQNSLAELETTFCPDTAIEQLNAGLRAVSSIASTVKSFQNFAVESSRSHVAEVDLKAVAERVVQLLDDRAWQAKTTVRLKGLDRLPPIYFNEKDLEQLFFVLVENTIEAADGKKDHRLIIGGTVKDKNIELRSSDNCSGIAPDMNQYG